MTQNPYQASVSEPAKAPSAASFGRLVLRAGGGLLLIVAVATFGGALTLQNARESSLHLHPEKFSEWTLWMGVGGAFELVCGLLLVVLGKDGQSPSE